MPCCETKHRIQIKTVPVEVAETETPTLDISSIKRAMAKHAKHKPLVLTPKQILSNYSFYIFDLHFGNIKMELTCLNTL